jgi:hypothetical protein
MGTSKRCTTTLGTNACAFGVYLLLVSASANAAILSIRPRMVKHGLTSKTPNPRHITILEAGSIHGAGSALAEVVGSYAWLLMQLP